MVLPTSEAKLFNRLKIILKIGLLLDASLCSSSMEGSRSREKLTWICISIKNATVTMVTIILYIVFVYVIVHMQDLHPEVKDGDT